MITLLACFAVAGVAWIGGAFLLWSLLRVAGLEMPAKRAGFLSLPDRD